MNFRESYWKVIRFVKRIVFVNNWETNETYIALLNRVKMKLCKKTCLIVFGGMFKNANVEKDCTIHVKAIDIWLCWNVKFSLINCKLFGHLIITKSFIRSRGTIDVSGYIEQTLERPEDEFFWPPSEHRLRLDK